MLFSKILTRKNVNFNRDKFNPKYVIIETGTNEAQSKGTASKAVKNTSSANDSLSFNYGRSGVNISINTSYAKK